MMYQITGSAARAWAFRVALAVSSVLLACSSEGGLGPVGTSSIVEDGEAAPGPRLAASATDLALDAQANGGAVAVTLTNVGAVDLVVTEIALEGAGFTASGVALPAIIPPAGAADLTVAFAADAGSASGTITISSNDLSSPTVLTVSGTGVTTPPPPTDSGSTFSWTKPADFDAQLAAAIAQQPEYAGGYGGQVANPFPEIEGTDRFSGLQITRVDAVSLGNYFGRPSFRFYVDSESRHSNGLRAEFTGARDFQFKAGDTYRYRFATYFPTEYKNSSWTDWNLFAQFHGPGFPAWGLNTSGGYLHMRAPDAEPNEYRIPMPARNVWHEFDWSIHWATDSSGWATLSMDGVRVFTYSGRTMDASEAYYYPKFGAYLANNPYTQITYSTAWTITRL